jgi:hypothetical protein
MPQLLLEQPDMLSGWVQQLCGTLAMEAPANTLPQPSGDAAADEQALAAHPL